MRDPSLRAFPYVEAAPALREHAERAPAGPFQGVPFAVKDLIHPVAGMPMRSGSAAYEGFVPDVDATLVTRYREAGLVLVGKTATPEFGLMGVTEPAAFRPTRNPWQRAARPAAPLEAPPPPSPRASSPSPTPRTEAGPSAFRPASAACLASSPRAGA